jgi:hypothetical protein
MADVQNRSVEAKYSYVHKKVETEKSIYLMKNDKEVTYHKENLKDHKAYIKVLANILNEKPKPDFDGKYGRYGPGCSVNTLTVQRVHVGFWIKTISIFIVINLPFLWNDIILLNTHGYSV